MGDLIKPSDEDLNKLNGYERVKAIAEYILRAKRKSSEDKTLSSPRILGYAKEEFPNANIVDTTFVVYLQKGGSDENSNLATQGRRQGYYISNFVEEIAREDEIVEENLETSDSTAQRRTKYEREKLLYPVLVNWVQDQGYRAKDTSNLRAAGKWSNPDVTGLRSVDTFGNIEVEIVFIEAKLNSRQWDYDIFEAISHRRFTNRSYFTFAATPEAIPKLNHASMRYYAELYGIGILAIVVDKQVWDTLNFSLREENLNKRVEPIRLDESDVLELYSAPFHYVHPKWQMDYCKNIGIGNVRDLLTWGEDSLPDT